MPARKPRPAATFDVRAIARSSADASRRTIWMHDDAATMAVAVLEHHPRPDLMTTDEVRSLVRAISTDVELVKHRHFVSVKVGGIEITCRIREIHIDGATLHYSPRMPGLFEREAIPDEPGIIAKSEALVRKQLSLLRYKGPPLIEVRKNDNRRSYGFDHLEFVTERPEGGGLAIETAAMEHQTDEVLAANARRIAEQIHNRHRNRHEIAGRVHGARLWIEEAITGVEGMTLVDIDPCNLTYKNGGLSSLSVYCRLGTYGDTLRPAVKVAMAHNGDHLRSLISQHRKSMDKLTRGGGIESTRTVNSILAAAIRGQMERFGEGMLREIEGLLAGQHVRPSEPVRRGISVFSMKGGELNGPVKLSKTVKYHKGRVNATQIRALPDTMMSALPGMNMRDVIDHPWLEGQVIQSATLNSVGLNIRPKAKSLPLQPLLDELRACVAAKKAAAPA
jgi:hypothetical protein